MDNIKQSQCSLFLLIITKRRDTWLMFLHLMDAVGDDLSRYDDNEAWPSLFDDFVEWANDRANQNVLHAKGDLQ